MADYHILQLSQMNEATKCNAKFSGLFVLQDSFQLVLIHKAILPNHSNVLNFASFFLSYTCSPRIYLNGKSLSLLIGVPIKGINLVAAVCDFTIQQSTDQ